MSSAIAMLTADPCTNIALRDRDMAFLILPPPGSATFFWRHLSSHGSALWIEKLCHQCINKQRRFAQDLPVRCLAESSEQIEITGRQNRSRSSQAPT
jgi:hypothetical protein